MNPKNALQAAIELIGLKPLAAKTGVSYQAIQQWVDRGRLPRTEYSGETNYAASIVAVCFEKDRHTKITRDVLLGVERATHHPPPIVASTERVA